MSPGKARDLDAECRKLGILDTEVGCFRCKQQLAMEGRPRTGCGIAVLFLSSNEIISHLNKKVPP
jgi:hypothetical protein